MAAVPLIALALTVVVLLTLRHVILRPLDYAIEQLDVVSKGDLTADIQVVSKNEIGKLLASVRRMQQSLISVVRQVHLGVAEIDVGSREIAAGNIDLSSRTEEQAGRTDSRFSSHRNRRGKRSAR